MSSPLEGKLALVTGAGGGIGQGVAAELGRQGASVVLHYAHSEAGAHKTAGEIITAGGKAFVIGANLANVNECFRVVDEAAGLLGGLDILVNNSGVTAVSTFEETTAEYFDEIFAINIRSHFFCAQRAVRYMKARGQGAILNMSSVHALASMVNHSVYAATKGAVVTLTRELALELAKYRIRVNALGPGLVEVDRHRRDPSYDHDLASKSIPLGRVGTPQDIASAVAFIVSDAASFMTGQMYWIDGGTTSQLSLRRNK